MDKRRDKKMRRAEKRAVAEDKDDDGNCESDELDDFSSDYKVMKKFKKGKISQDEFDEAFNLEDVTADC